MGLALLVLGMHIELRDSLDSRVQAAMTQFHQQLAECMVVAKDARTTAKLVEREHLEQSHVNKRN